MVVALARWHVLFSRSITLFRVQFGTVTVSLRLYEQNRIEACKLEMCNCQLTRDALRHVRVAGKLSPADRARAVHAVMRLKMFSGGVANEAYNLRGLIYGYKAAKAGSRALVKYMDDYNKRVMGGTLSRLVEVMDKKQRIWCFEGPPSVVADLYQFVSTQTSIQKHGRALYHPQCRWTERLYSALPLRLYVVKLRRALRNLLIARVDCGGDSLSRLGELQLCRSIWHLKTMRSVWPTVDDLDDIHTKYGDFVSDSELLGGCFGDEEDRASKKRMGRSNSVTTAASSPRTEEGSQREGGAEENSAGEEFGTQRALWAVSSLRTPLFEQVLRERRGRKGKKERKEESNALEESIRRALQSRRTYDGASGPFNYSIQTYNSVVTKEQERLRNDFTQGIYSFASASADDPVSADPSSKAAASRECLSNTLDLGRMNQGMPSLKERLAAAQRASDRRRVEWRHPRPSSPSAYRRADHIHTVPLSNARLEELSGAMPWEPATNDFLLLQSQRVPKCRVGAPVDPQGFGPKSTSKRFIRQFGPPSIYK
ncbi:hypothetical protein FOZ60_012025 [Perkinsus olseni]|uniref:Uncharacterized protein n=1 Tax=Perkinsus olseni TaxID=32597 RepID=A0A7J6PA39_PEROL|nr:hypothetical protein FOZ60_012025 [Perkinsus olseni]